MSRNLFASYLFGPGEKSGQQNNSSRRQSRLRGGYVPRMESLEDRVVLSALSVVNLDDSGPGSLRAAIEDANSTVGVPDVIEFAPGVQGTINLTSGELSITDELTINGPGKNSLTISGGGQSRVFDITDTSVAMGHLTIADGYTAQDLTNPALHGTAGGAGIRATTSDVSLVHMIVENNRIEGSVFDAGAGLQAQNGSSVNLDHVTFRNNESTGLFFTGGGAIDMDQSSLTVSHSQFEDNLAANHPDSTFSVGGGAIKSSGGTTSISHSRFADNSADGLNNRGQGGAITNSFGNAMEVHSSSFHNNSVVGLTTAGGAISTDFNFNVPVVISHSQFVNNSAVAESQLRDVGGVSTVVGGDAQGGAIATGRISTVNIVDSLLIGNYASGDVLAAGGAIANRTGSTLTVDNSWIAFNRVDSAGDALGGGIYNDAVEGSLFGGFFTGDSTVTLTNSRVYFNSAIGDDGVGGGVYDVGNEAFDSLIADDSTAIKHNTASDSHDDVFGDLTALDELLTLV